MRFRILLTLATISLIIGCQTPKKHQLTDKPVSRQSQVRSNTPNLLPPLPETRFLGAKVSRGLVRAETAQNASNPGVTLAWDPVSGVTGYKVYFGPLSHSYTNAVDVGNVTTSTVPAEVLLPRWYAVTAYNASGESDFSTELQCSTLQGRVFQWQIGPLGAPPAIQTSTNLRTWQVISPPFTFLPANAFYRLRVQ